MDMNPRLTSVVFRLHREKLDALKELSRSTRIRQSEYLREAISDLLAKYEDRLVDWPASSPSRREDERWRLGQSRGAGPLLGREGIQLGRVAHLPEHEPLSRGP